MVAKIINGTEHNRNVITLKLLQFLVTLHTYTTIYKTIVQYEQIGVTHRNPRSHWTR